jgi:O-antigen ligase
MGSARVQDRVSTAIAETHRFSQEIDGAGAASLYNNSSGWRINAWSRSVESIRESPWFGNGVGSWAVSVKTLEGANAQKIFGDGNASNPHQEYLLWGVELGVLGIFGLIAVFVALGWDSRNQPTEPKRATFSVIAALSVACLFNSVLYDDLIGDFFCILIGLLMAYGNKSLGDRENT